MLMGEYRRSARIFELDSRKAQQAKSQIGGSGTIKSGRAQGGDTRKVSHHKLVRKRKTRPVHDLVDNDVESQDQKAGGDGDHRANAVDMSSLIAMPERKMIDLLLHRLQRRDTFKIFAEPVDGNEVKHYYDVIKHPMDFSKITQKLNDGLYTTLGEFEHDIYLMFNNAMQFNASHTYYYRTAHAMKELANKLFQTLKYDPENFEKACSMRGVGPGKRNKAVAGSTNSNSCNKTSGMRGERGSENFELQPRQSYIPRTSCATEKELSLTQVYNSSKTFKPVNQNKIGYAKSLLRFANNLGPTAQIVAQRKLGSGIAETSEHQAATFNFQAPENYIPVASARANITTAPLLKFQGNSLGCQRSSGREVEYHSPQNGQKTPAVGTVDLYDVLRGGIAQTSTTMKALDEMRGKMLHAPMDKLHGIGSAQKSITVAPSAKLLGKSASRELDIWNGNLSGQKASVEDNPLSGAITLGSSTNGNLHKERGKMVQTTNGGFVTDATFGKPISSSRYKELDFPEGWVTDGNRNGFSFLKFMLDAVKSPDQKTEVVSSGSDVTDLPAGYSCPSSCQRPVQNMSGGSNRSQAIEFRPGVDKHSIGGVQLPPIQEIVGLSSRGSGVQGGQANWLNLKIEGESSSTQPFDNFQRLDSNYAGRVHQMQPTADKSDPSPGGTMLSGGQVQNWLKPTVSLSSSNQPFSSFQGLEKNYIGGGHQIQPTVDKEGPSHRSGMLPGGQVQNWLKPTVSGSSITQPFGSIQGLDLNYLGGVQQIQPTADKAGPSHGGSMLPGSQIPDWLKATELASDAVGTSHGSSINGGQFSNWFKPIDVGSNAAATQHGSNPINGGHLSNWFKPLEDVVRDHGSSTTNGGQFSNWFKPTEFAPYSITGDWGQQQFRYLTTPDLSSQAEPWQHQQHWANIPGGSMIKPPNFSVLDNDKGATSGHGQLTLGTPTYDQPLQESGFPRLDYHP